MCECKQENIYNHSTCMRIHKHQLLPADTFAASVDRVVVAFALEEQGCAHEHAQTKHNYQKHFLSGRQQEWYEA